MGQYDFSTLIDRRNTNSVKWDPEHLKRLCGNPQAIPFWVADMDFRSPPEVLDALHRRIDHGVFGYVSGTEEAVEEFCRWTSLRHGWRPEPEEVCYTPGIIAGLSAAVQVFTEPGDGVVIQTPAYRPFFSVITANRREVRENPLHYENGAFSIDFPQLEQQLERQDTSMLILCSPHNPSGRVWTADELKRIRQMAQAHGVLVVSDEIHGDMTYPGYTHIPYSTIDPGGITCMAPSKTFNIPGEHYSCIVLPDEQLRKRYAEHLKTAAISQPPLLSFTAAAAAYRSGKAWLDELLGVLTSHVDLMESALRSVSPQIRLIRPEASFIAFLDVREAEKQLGSGRDFVTFMGKEAGIALHRGSWFGRSGRGFARINFGTPQTLLEEGLSKMVRALEHL